ncbi:hypothetical protein SISNIDRAFT_518634, partial [Sistotremastrum niveocremeum HHB9708]
LTVRTSTFANRSSVVGLRRNSTSSPSAPTSSAPSSTTSSDLSLSVPPFPDQLSSSSSSSKEDFDPSTIPGYLALKQAFESHDAKTISSSVTHYRSTCPTPTTAGYNMALQALHSVREPGAPLTPLLETYNEMLAKDLMPNIRTYRTLITALCERDHEIMRVTSTLEGRMKRRNALGLSSQMADEADSKRIAALSKENNFASAFLLFQAVSALRNIPLHANLYTLLLRSCVYHKSIDAAIRIFAHLERHSSTVLPTARIYYHLIGVYNACGDYNGAREVFEEFREMSKKEGAIYWADEDNSPTPSRLARISQSQIWTEMIKAHFSASEPSSALTLFEQMLDTPRGLEFGPEDPPMPCIGTYTAIIRGFCTAGDLDTALVWFWKLLEREGAGSPRGRSVYEPIQDPVKPHVGAWIVLLEELAKAGRVKELNALFERMGEEEGVRELIRGMDRILVAGANMEYLAERKESLSTEEYGEIVQFVLDKVLLFGPPTSPSPTSSTSTSTSTSTSVKNGKEYFPEHWALRREEFHFTANHVLLLLLGASPSSSSASSTSTSSVSRSAVTSPAAPTGSNGLGQSFIGLKDALALARTYEDKLLFIMNEDLAPYFIRSYITSLSTSESSGRDLHSELTKEEWSMLMFAVASNELPGYNERTFVKREGYIPLTGVEKKAIAAITTSSLLRELAKTSIDPEEFDVRAKRHIIRALTERLGVEGAVGLLKDLGGKFEMLLDKWQYVESPSADFPFAQPPTYAIIDESHGRYVDEYFPSNRRLTARDGFSRFIEGLSKGIYPPAEVIGRLINAMGRLGDRDAVRKLYDSAQIVLSSMEQNLNGGKEGSLALAWFQVEDQMIIALAHAGDLDSANVHRERIMSQGGAPSADAYGALITGIKDTTDDVSNAMQLWIESQSRGVKPNMFLYNTIISRLAKARKAEFALELFHQMKASGIYPSSVTYGAVIAACCRVGDAHSAEALFAEMQRSRKYTPRVPPFNTMIQLYTHTKPNMEKVTYYYNAMKAARVAPSAHTYKLLLDAYGTIQPVNTKAMEDIFAALVADRQVQVNGTHWAALINSYGCAQKNLEKALAIFDSIPTHPSTQPHSNLPDAVVYEALINVLVTLHQTDLIPSYLARLRRAQVHMTAYIANLLIKGHAAAGNLGLAREVFEGLLDPPMGVAAPMNHAPHDGKVGSASSMSAPADAPVYREPSTWEAIVRAELGAGNRQEALDLISRMQARAYPPAVVHRVSGILHDEPSSPYGSFIPPSESPSSSAGLFPLYATYQ